MAGVEQVVLDVLEVTPVRVGPGGREDGVVLAPDDEGRRLVLAEVVVPLGVLRRVAAVAVEQGQLDLRVAGPVQERLVDGPGVRADRLDVADAVGVLPPRRLQGQELRSGSAFSSVRSFQYALSGIQKSLSSPSS